MRSKEPKCPIANMVCPRNNDPEKGAYCPAWVEYTEHNHQTGEDRVTKECSFTALPKFMAHTLSAANRPAAAIEQTRNELVSGFSQVAQTLQNIPQIRQENNNGE